MASALQCWSPSAAFALWRAKQSLTPDKKVRFFSRFSFEELQDRQATSLVRRRNGCKIKVATMAPTTSVDKDAATTSESQLELVDPEFYRMGFVRHVRAYGVEFKEGPMGMGVYAAKDIECLNKPRVILEVPLELMITVSKNFPWMFNPDIVPIGHPIFDVINSTNPKTDWDIRLACLLLLAIDQKDNFWKLYSEYLPAFEDINSLLLATKEELLELQDETLSQRIQEQQVRAVDFWERSWPVDAPLKLKRLARQSDQFVWALAAAQSRSFIMTLEIGSLVKDTNMLIPYADMLNHSFIPTCSFRFRRKDRMLEVVMNAGQSIKKGDEMTLNYLNNQPNDVYMQRYGFSSAVNPWDVVKFTGKSKIHLESFLSAFNLAGTLEELYYSVPKGSEVEDFVDGAVIAAARMLPMWSDGDVPFLPSAEIQAARELQLECAHLLDRYATNLDQDHQIFDAEMEHRSPRWISALKYRVDRKSIIHKTMRALDLYMERILH